MPIQAKAAICWDRNEPWRIEQIEWDDPQDYEVVVKVVASGMCHSEMHTVTGDLPVDIPIIGGHEGAGYVESIGSKVTRVKSGDAIITSYLPTCGQCRACVTGHSNLCNRSEHMMRGAFIDGSQRARARGRYIGATSMISTFSNYSVMPEDSLVKVPDDTPLEKACIIACAVTTGWGSAVNVGEVRPGDTVVVVGIGGIGGSAVQGARVAGARNIVAVDVAPGKEAMAKSIGATHFATDFNSALQIVRGLTEGQGADSAILTPGVVTGDMIQPLIELVRKGGIAVVTGIAPWESLQVNLQLAHLTLWEKQLRGSLFGMFNPQTAIPDLVALAKSGQLDLDAMITKNYRLEDINEAYQDQADGRLLRGVIIHEH